MIRPDITFSAAALLESCRWWTMPGVAWVNNTSDSAEGGTLGHKAVSAIVAGETIAVDDPAIAAMVARVRAWLLARGFLQRAANGVCRGAAGLRSEVAYAYDTATGIARELADPVPEGEGPGEGPRWYADPARRKVHGVRETEVCGRTDLVCTAIDGAGAFQWVIELKFHFGAEVVDARAQLETQSLAVARVPAEDGEGYDRIRPLALHVWEDRLLVEHVDDEGEWAFSRPEHLETPADLGAWELTAIAERWERFANPPGNDPVPEEGAHCRTRYCNARAACPVGQAVVADELFPAARLVRQAAIESFAEAEAKTSVALALVPAIGASPPDPIALPPVTPDGFAFLPDPESNAHAAWQLVACDLLEEILTEKKKRLKAYADTQEPVGEGGLRGILQSDGKVWGGEVQPKASINLDAPGAKALLESLGLGLAIETSESISWDAIKELQGEPGARRAREELGAIDALTVTNPVVYQARRPKADAKRARRRSA